MKQLGIIGCGRIGAPLIKAVQSGQAGEWSLLAVLTQTERELDGLVSLTDADSFFKNDFDLIIDAASPVSMSLYGERALSVANLWTVNAAALADNELFSLLEDSGRKNGNRLRVLSGAIAGLDGLAAISVDEDAQVLATVDVAPSTEGRKTLFKGSVREGGKLFPESVNVAVATGLAGTGLDNVQIEVIQPDSGEDRNLSIEAKSQYGQLEVKAIPAVRPDKGIHMVAACLIAALRQEDEVIWVG